MSEPSYAYSDPKNDYTKVIKDSNSFVADMFEKYFEPVYTLECTGYYSKEPNRFESRFVGSPMKIELNSKWATDEFDCAWFHVQCPIPENIKHQDLMFMLNFGGEGLLYSHDGVPIQSITNFIHGVMSGLDTCIKENIMFDSRLIYNGKFDFWIDGAANNLFGSIDNEARVTKMFLGRLHHEIRALAYDVQVLVSAVNYSFDRDYAARVAKSLKSVVCETVTTDRKAASLRKILSPLLKETNSDNSDTFTYSAIGHGHLDLAWKWPLRESHRKGGRTFATQIKNIKRFPEYVFGASQAQLYEWVKNDYPDIYADIKKYAKKGSWDVQGATWVEMDSNLTCGESLVRQFLYGKKFFNEEFGQDMQILWLPDSFGYSACLPQLMKLAEVPYFLTQKMCWNIVNKFPYHSFFWEGLDGTQVLAHMLPEDLYCSSLHARLLCYGEKNYQERSISNISMSLFGISDGGAGPGAEHIERGIRYKNLRGIPKVRMEKSLDFFKRLDDHVTKYPSYAGELYLERHQGTYTTQSFNKKSNRQCETLLRNYEMLSIIARDKGLELPFSDKHLEKLWKEVLLYQFHDILPGSSINRVYNETHTRYVDIMNELTNSIKFFTKLLCDKGAVINLLPYTYKKKIKLNKKWFDLTVPALGYVSPDMDTAMTEFTAVKGDNFIENDSVRVVFDRGVIVSLFDKKQNHEYVPENGSMGVISQYTDNGDCWDMEGSCMNYYATKLDSVCTGFKTYTDGAEAGAVCSYAVGDSVFTATYCIHDGESMVNCVLDMDVHQQSKMLRIAFATSVETDKCSYNTQYGHLTRPTTENNSIETAQFECCGQKFVDLSCDTYGLSFINDAKYGYRCKYGVIDVNLVRSPKEGPGENVDQGKQTMRFALLPHAGMLGEETYKQAYFVNNLFLITEGKTDGTEKSFYNTDNESVVLDTIKTAEDGNGIIVRLYNSSDNPQFAHISIAGYKPFEIVNILEHKLSDAPKALSLHKFELVNLRFIKE